MSFLLLLLGGLFLVLGVLFIVVQAFGEGVLWGLATIFIPFAFLAFVILHWSETRKPLLAMVAGLVLVMASSSTAPKDAAAADATAVEASAG
jgi:hypothetical protein